MSIMSIKIFFQLSFLLLLFADVQAEDRMDLDETSIKGARDLPKISYIVPWKRTGQGILSLQAKRASIKADMMPLDREVYRRELEYFSLIHGTDSGVSR